ncbi:MAG TPA: hypothetical protein VMW68_10035 [Methyloceanibacter sp.]|nr:hypothetical protein [Methyloceanibacter sp.]
MEEDGKGPGKFIGFIERYDYAWRASFRTLAPGAVFSQEGESKVFATEAEAVKWLHEQASERGFESITMRNETDPH